MVDLSIVMLVYQRVIHIFSVLEVAFFEATKMPTIAWWSPEECNLMEGADGYLHDAEDCAEERRLVLKRGNGKSL